MTTRNIKYLISADAHFRSQTTTDSIPTSRRKIIKHFQTDRTEKRHIWFYETVIVKLIAKWFSSICRTSWKFIGIQWKHLKKKAWSKLHWRSFGCVESDTVYHRRAFRLKSNFQPTFTMSHEQLQMPRNNSIHNRTKHPRRVSNNNNGYALSRYIYESTDFRNRTIRLCVRA